MIINCREFAASNTESKKKQGLNFSYFQFDLKKNLGYYILPPAPTSLSNTPDVTTRGYCGKQQLA